MAIKQFLLSKFSKLKHVRQLLAYPDSATGFIQTHFLLASPVRSAYQTH